MKLQGKQPLSPSQHRDMRSRRWEKAVAQLPGGLESVQIAMDREKTREWGEIGEILTEQQ
eukprot:scaffold4209_cov160-Ochromonas_danica.AAC.13